MKNENEDVSVTLELSLETELEWTVAVDFSLDKSVAVGKSDGGVDGKKKKSGSIELFIIQRYSKFLLLSINVSVWSAFQRHMVMSLKFHFASLVSDDNFNLHGIWSQVIPRPWSSSLYLLLMLLVLINPSYSPQTTTLEQLVSTPMTTPSMPNVIAAPIAAK
jgi:hypothetical protein